MDREELSRRRVQYEADGFDVADADPDPVRQFESWFDDVADHLDQPNAMIVATADQGGEPSARTVLLRGLDDRGPVFYTNYESAKGRDLESNPRAELLFVWLTVHRQVRVTGPVNRVSEVESDAYFGSRPRYSQIGAWASAQSAVVPDRATLDALVAETERRFEDGEVPRPPHWGGYRVTPETWEFWQGRADRLHDRVRYRLQDERWVIERLAP
ncbi:MAG: pyridoxamine 5'-phosphate oxidase [Acidimicrobiales bacterium]